MIFAALLLGCAPEPTGLRLEVSLGAGVDRAEALARVEAARAYYAEHAGIDLQVTAVRDRDLRWAIGGAPSEVDPALRALGIDPATPAAPEQRYAADQAFARVALRIPDAIAREPADAIRVVFVRELLEPDSMLRGDFDRLEGWTLAPNTDTEITGALALPAEFAPVIFVSMLRRPGDPDFVLPHELGHALGLPHVAAGKDLMWSGLLDAAPQLSEEERIRIQAEAVRWGG